MGKRGSRPHVSNWTKNGSQVLYFDRRSGGIWIADPTGRSKPTEFLHTELNERWARVSPDGKLIAYVGGSRHERREVYVQQYPELGKRIRVSINGGGEPLWFHDSKILFFRQNDAVFASVITLDDDLHAGKPTLLFSGNYDEALAGHQHYDISLDGKKFLMVKHGERTRPTSVHVISNWTSQLVIQQHDK